MGYLGDRSTYFEYVQTYPDTQVVSPVKPCPPPMKVSFQAIVHSFAQLTLCPSSTLSQHGLGICEHRECNCEIHEDSHCEGIKVREIEDCE
jgi:hypothetical protein